MQVKKIFSVLILALVSSSLSANDDIPLWQEDPSGPGNPTNPRSIVSEITASIDGQVVTVSFSDLTTSQIVVTDPVNQTVFNQTYSAAYGALADLSSLSAGNYTIHIYAYGSWWIGTFSIE